MNTSLLRVWSRFAECLRLQKAIERMSNDHSSEELWTGLGVSLWSGGWAAERSADCCRYAGSSRDFSRVDRRRFQRGRDAGQFSFYIRRTNSRCPRLRASKANSGMKVLLDEDLPHNIGPLLTGHNVFTTQHMGWAGVKNRALLKVTQENGFEAFVTAD